MKWICTVVAAAAALTAPNALAAGAAQLGVQVKLDRPAPIYAINDQLSMTISAASPVVVEISLINDKGERTPIVPSKGSGPLHLAAGQTARVPERGALTVTPPPGRYQIKVSASIDRTKVRSIAHADSRLDDRDVREDQSIFFTVEDVRSR
jgi:hypothetical protein